jgi:hypothetical protein
VLVWWCSPHLDDDAGREIADHGRSPSYPHEVTETGDISEVSKERDRRTLRRRGDTVPEETSEMVEEMFVQLARGLTSSSGGLTLEGIGPSTLYFSDRPERIVGHMTTTQFLDLWDQGPDSFEEDPPNAVLSFPDASGALADAVVVLRSPALQGDALHYEIDVLEGKVPVAAGACTLFIDPLGRPLSPVSIAGVHRRERRRMRRRF